MAQVPNYVSHDPHMMVKRVQDIISILNGSIGADNVNFNTPPANSSATGTQGMIATDSNYIYVCVATNTWKRVALSAF